VRREPYRSAADASGPWHIAEAARVVAKDLGAAGFTVRVLAAEVDELSGVVPVDGGDAAAGAEIVFALGGDGTLLRAAELARPFGVPLLGVNLGKVGFLAEAEAGDLDAAVRKVVAREYEVDERLTLDVTVHHDGAVVAHSWALNEASVEKGARERMLEVRVDVAGDCPGTGATASSARPRRARPRTRSRPAARWCGRRSRRYCSCRSLRTRCSAGRW
jgi:hypothetical protein